MSISKKEMKMLKKAILGLGVASAIISVMTVSLSIYLSYHKEK